MIMNFYFMQYFYLEHDDLLSHMSLATFYDGSSEFQIITSLPCYFCTVNGSRRPIYQNLAAYFRTNSAPTFTSKIFI